MLGAMELSRPGRHRRLAVVRIRTHLALLVLVTAWPLAVLLAYTARHLAQVEEKQAGAQALRAARAIAAEAERTLQHAQVLLTQVARRPQVRRLDAADCDPLFGAFGSLFPDYTNLVTVRLDGGRICSALSARPDILAQPLLPLAASASAGTPRVVWGHGEPVLSLDDDEVMRVMAERLPQRAGFDVRCCRSARDALAAVHAAAPPSRWW